MEENRDTSEQGSGGEPPARPGLSRREVLGGAVMLGVGAGLGHVLTPSGSAARAQPEAVTGAVPFHGAHQAGVVTRAQSYMHFAAFDLTSGSVDDLRSLLKEWTAAAQALTAGLPYEPSGPTTPLQVPVDGGEALGLDPAQLTITVGFGPSLFVGGRFAQNAQGPELQVLPAFIGDRLDPAHSGGDLCVQACADDPQVAFHAIHLFSRLAGPVATVRWTQLGFGRTASTTRAQTTPRNLMGFKDGTENIRAEDTAELDEYVWVQRGDEPAWMAGGTYLVARRIRILFDRWDAISLREQEQTIGRAKLSGAPLGSASEFDAMNLSATSPNGEPVIPNDAHVRIASPQTNSGQRILRRGYSYTEEVDSSAGEIDAGLFFIAFQRSPTHQFIPIQTRLSNFDALNHHTVHTSSAMFACPPGVQPGGYIGETLLS